MVPLDELQIASSINHVVPGANWQVNLPIGAAMFKYESA